MRTNAAPRYDVRDGLPRDAHTSDFRQAVLDGLSAHPKQLSPKYFYDEEGARLFEAITKLPEYYPTRTEMHILNENGAALAEAIPPNATVVEFGSGSSRKFRALLHARPDIAAYVSVDISAAFLNAEARQLRRDFPALAVVPVAGDFTQPFDLPQFVARRRVGFFPGSTIGNFEPEMAASFLRHARNILGKSILIIGVDLPKDPARLEAAYDDAQGVTAAFNLNLLRRINRELDGTFDLEAFKHVALYNADCGRIEMHLESTRAQTVHVGAKAFAFIEGERIHTENSYKHSVEGFQALATMNGWTPSKVLTDSEALFSVHILHAD